MMSKIYIVGHNQLAHGFLLIIDIRRCLNTLSCLVLMSKDGLFAFHIPHYYCCEMWRTKRLVLLQCHLLLKNPLMITTLTPADKSYSAVTVPSI